MKIIGISGWKGSGKDLSASFLIDKFSAQRVGFADPLKDSVADEFEIDRASLDDPARKEAPLLDMPVTPQDAYSLMIANFLFKEFADKDGLKATTVESRADNSFVGFTNGGWNQLYWTPRALAILKGSTNRSTDSAFWVKKALNKIVNFNEMLGVQLFAISDLRYKSELKQLQDWFGKDFVSVRIERFDTSPSTDPSERDLDDATFDHYVDNRGTPEKTYEQLEAIVKSLK